MHRRICSLLMVALLSALSSVVVLAVPAMAAPAACVQPPFPRLPTGATAAEPRLILQAREVASLGQLDAAKALYERALAADPPDPSAGFGLAYVAARRAAAAAAATTGTHLAAAGRTADSEACFRLAVALDAANSEALAALDPAHPATRAEHAATGWAAFYASWIDPAVQLLLPALAVLVVLLVLARLLTPLSVPAGARAWRDPWRQVAWWGGFVLLCAAAVVGMSVAVTAANSPRSRAWLSIVVLTAGVTGAVALVVLRTSRRAGPAMRRAAWSVLAAGVIGYGILAPLGHLTIPRSWFWWLVSAATAAIGCLLVAAGRGHALRLQIVVKQGDTTDPVGTAYVLGRLQELGSAPPRGLKTPQQVDVTDLPSAALSSLPVGRVATALAPLIGLLTPSVPWRATVQDGLKDQSVLVTLTRNGSVAQTALVDAGRFLPRPADDPTADATADATGTPPPEAVARGDLLTAAAAVILTELAERHTALEDGLCGARRWDSVAAYVVATKPPASAGGVELRRQLLAYAVEVDPDNAFARLAYANLLGEGAARPEELRAHAALLQRVYATIERQAGPSGFLLLRLRALHALAAAHLNLAVTSAADRAAALARAEGALTQFDTLLTESQKTLDRPPTRFLTEMRLISGQLKLAGAALCTPPGAAPVEPISLERPLYVLYDEACRLALAGTDPTGALDRLEVAAGLHELRDSAVRDPWFTTLRQPSGDGSVATRFWAIVGADAPAFTDLPPFGTNGAALRAMGIEAPSDLLAATAGDGGPWDLATTLRVSTAVVEAWREFAALGALPGPSGRPLLSTRELALLAWAGVRTPRALVTADAAALMAELTAVAEEHRLLPPSLADVRSWRTPVPAGG